MSAALATTSAALVTETLLAQREEQAADKQLHVAVNQYTCGTLYQRDNIDFWTRLDEIKNAGVDGIEVTLGSGNDAETLGKRLADHGLAMRSIYAGGNLHD